MDMTYDGGISFIDKEKEEYTWGDAFRLNNPLGGVFQNPDDYRDGGRVPGYHFTQEEGWDKLTPSQIDWVADARSPENFRDRLSLSQQHTESMQRFAEDPDTFGKYSMSFAAGMADPIGMLPVAGVIGKLNQVSKATTTLGRMATTGLGAGGVGAASNMASEALFEAQGAPTDYTSAAIWGFALGGTLGGVFEGVSRTNYQRRMAEALSRDDLDAGIKLDEMTFSDAKPPIDNPLAPPIINKITNPATGQVEKIERGSKFWLASDIHRIWSSTLDSVRNFAQGADIPSVVTKSKLGTTTRDYSKILDGSVHEAQVSLATSYRDAIVDGSFKGSVDDYFTQAGRDYHKIAAEQEIKVYSDPELKAIEKEYQQQIQDIKKMAAEDLKSYETGIEIMKEKKLSKEEVSATKKALKEEKLKLEDTVAKLSDEMEKVKKTKADELWAKYKPEVPKHLQPMQKYFNTMLKEGQEVGVKDLDGISMDRLYIPRQLDFNTIKGMDTIELTNRIENALRNHPENIGISDVDLKETAGLLASDWKTKGVDLDYNDPLFKGRTHLENKKTYGARRLKVDNREIVDLLQSNAADVMGGYHYFSRGQVALRKAYPELRNTYSVKTEANKDEFIEEVFEQKFVRPVEEEIVAKGLSREEYLDDIDAMRRVLRDLTGQQRLFTPTDRLQAKWYEGARIASQANSAALSGWFGLNQALEIPSAMWATGFNRLFHKQFGSMMADVVKALWKDTGPNQEFMKELMRTGYLSSLLEQSGINRMADTTTVFNMGKIENALHKLNSKLFKYNGMRAMTSFMEAMVASNVVTLIKKVGKSDKDLGILKKFGLDDADITAINKELDRVGDIYPDGTINKLGLDEMEPTVKERLQVAMSRAIEEGVIQGDTMKLPSWMITPGPFKQLVMQFMRFPIAANEILLRKGLTDDQAGMAASVVGTYMMGMAFRYLEEQARVGLGVTDKSETKYDITTEEGLINNVIKNTNYIAAFGGLLLPYQYATMFAQQSQFGTDYRSNNTLAGIGGVTASRVQTVSDLMRMAIDGKTDSTKFWKGLHSFSPLSNLPLYKDGVRMLIEENTLNY